MEQTHPIPATVPFSVLAIFSLVFGVLAWTLLPVMGLLLASINLFNFVVFPLCGAVIASICGRMAQKRIRASNGLLRGAGLAKAGQVMAYVQYALFGLLLLLGLVQAFFLSQQTTHL